MWNARLLPFWYVAIYLLAAAGIAEVSLVAGEWWGADSKQPKAAPTVLAVFLAAVDVAVVTGGGLGILPSWMGISQSGSGFVREWASPGCLSLISLFLVSSGGKFADSITSPSN